MRISDWSSDVCSSDLTLARRHDAELGCLLDGVDGVAAGIGEADYLGAGGLRLQQERGEVAGAERMPHGTQHLATCRLDHGCGIALQRVAEGVVGCQEERSEEHTSELQSLMRISYAVFCLK